MVTHDLYMKISWKQDLKSQLGLWRGCKPD